MNSTIALFLLQDGVINGAIYALVAIALVLVFAVTRVILVPQGHFIAFAAFSTQAFEQGRLPQTASLLMVLSVLTIVATTAFSWKSLTAAYFVRNMLSYVAIPLALVAVAAWIAPTKPTQLVAIILTILLIVPMGPMLYRIAFEPLQHASVLVLPMAALGLHFCLQGLSLLFFGPEGIGTKPLLGGSFTFGDLLITGQSVAVVATTVLCILAFSFLFERTLVGKALRACSSNRLGARLVGISPLAAGQTAFALAALLGAVSGVLIAPIITVYYDSGFIIGLKAFVAAIIAGLLSFPATVVAAIAVATAEAFFSFWASNFKRGLSLYTALAISSMAVPSRAAS